MLFEIDYPLTEQPQDAWQKLFESLDDTSIWKGHLNIKKISEEKDDTGTVTQYVRESTLAFRKSKQIERIIRDSTNLSLKFEYAKGPLKGYQIFLFEYGQLRITGDISLRGIYFPFTRFGLKHILDGELNALDRLFKNQRYVSDNEEAEKFGKH